MTKKRLTHKEYEILFEENIKFYCFPFEGGAPYHELPYRGKQIKIIGKIRKRIKRWGEENCQDYFYISHENGLFINEEDAVLFKLRWT